jgi:hypothetical protein
MRRLLQFATVLLLLAGFIAPIVEIFDHWDPEGLSDDTEFGVFALLLVLTFVLCVCKLISSSSLRFVFKTCSRYSKDENRAVYARRGGPRWVLAITPPNIPPPLRI